LSTSHDRRKPPPQPARRSRQISFAVRPWQEQALAAEAEKQGMSIGALARSFVVQELHRRGYGPRNTTQEENR